MPSQSRSTEYRHVFLNNLRANVGNVVWWMGLGGATFVGAATASSCESYRGWFSRESWRFNAGYGLFAYTHLLGVAPQFLRLDVAFPFGRRPSTCLGEELPSFLAVRQGLDAGQAERLLPELNVNLTFGQPF